MLQFLGKVSYSLYLVHEPLIYLTHYLLNGPIPNEAHPCSWCSALLLTPSDPEQMDKEGKPYEQLHRPRGNMPAWAIPVVIGTALVLAVLLEKRGDVAGAEEVVATGVAIKTNVRELAIVVGP